MNTATRNEQQFTEYLEQIRVMVSDLPNDKLRNNYSYERLKIDEWVAVSVFEGGFSSIAWRPLWNNNCRILNRFYKIPSYRFENNQAKVSTETLAMISQQLDAAKQMDFDCAFMSRETNTQAFNHYKKHLPQQWITPKERYKMYNDGYQHVMWTALNTFELVMEKENV